MDYSTILQGTLFGCNFSFVITEIVRFATIYFMMFLIKRYGDVKLFGLGLGVGMSLCQVLVQSVPYLTLATSETDFYLMSDTIGTFPIVAISGLCYSIYLIASYVCISNLLMKTQ
ncbi:Transmembrane protein [Entamoeba marina]